MDIRQATALVTRSNRGLGRALVDALLEAGVRKLYATARDPSTLDALVRAYPKEWSKPLRSTSPMPRRSRSR